MMIGLRTGGSVGLRMGGREGRCEVKICGPGGDRGEMEGIG